MTSIAITSASRDLTHLNFKAQSTTQAICQARRGVTKPFGVVVHDQRGPSKPILVLKHSLHNGFVTFTAQIQQTNLKHKYLLKSIRSVFALAFKYKREVGSTRLAAAKYGK